MSLLFSGLCLFGGLLISAISFNFVIRLAKADPFESERSAERVGKSLKNALLGKAKTVDDWLPDARIKAGMVFNEKENRFEVSGRLSNEAFGRVFPRRAKF